MWTAGAGFFMITAAAAPCNAACLADLAGHCGAASLTSQALLWRQAYLAQRLQPLPLATEPDAPVTDGSKHPQQDNSTTSHAVSVFLPAATALQLEGFATDGVAAAAAQQAQLQAADAKLAAQLQQVGAELEGLQRCSSSAAMAVDALQQQVEVRSTGNLPYLTGNIPLICPCKPVRTV